MNKCKDCVFWGEVNEGDGLRACNNPKLREDVYKPLIKADMLLYGGHYGYDAFLNVGPEFGCIHWQD